MILLCNGSMLHNNVRSKSYIKFEYIIIKSFFLYFMMTYHPFLPCSREIPKGPYRAFKTFTSLRVQKDTGAGSG